MINGISIDTYIADVTTSIVGLTSTGSAILRLVYQNIASAGIYISGNTFVEEIKDSAPASGVELSGEAILNFIYASRILVSCRFKVNEIVYIPDFRHDKHIRKKVKGICALNLGSVYYDVGNDRWLPERYLMSFAEYRDSLLPRRTLVPRDVVRNKMLVPFLTSQVVDS